MTEWLVHLRTLRFRCGKCFEDELGEAHDREDTTKGLRIHSVLVQQRKVLTGWRRENYARPAYYEVLRVVVRREMM
jgi:hypothetical protein